MSRIPLGTPGVTYILANGSMPGLLKVGCTTATAEERAKQLTASTASPTPFFVAYSRQTSDANRTEKQIHTALAAYRVNEGREFFRVSLYEAARTLDAICGDVFSHLEPATPFAELYASFQESDEPELNEEERRACRQLERQLAKQ